MLYVAIWYVSIRYEGEERTALEQYQILCTLLDYRYTYSISSSILFLRRLRTVSFIFLEIYACLRAGIILERRPSALVRDSACCSNKKCTLNFSETRDINSKLPVRKKKKDGALPAQTLTNLAK